MKLFWAFILAITLFSSGCAPKDKSQPKAPLFPSTGQWLESKPLDHQFFKGKTTLVYFWDYTCLNCLRDLSYVRTWYQRYKPYGFQVVLVHSPEFSFASRPENVQKALQYYDLHFPVYLDNDFQLWKLYQIYSWPAKVLVNHLGRIIRTEVGEGRYVEYESLIRLQLGIMDPRMILPEPAFADEPFTYEEEECGVMSNETYLGYKRAHWFGGQIANQEWTRPEKTSVFRDRGARVPRGFFLHGLWTNREEAFLHARNTPALSDYLGLSYRGSQVYSVLSSPSPDKEISVYVTRDGEPIPKEKRGRDISVDPNGKTYIALREARLYELISHEDDQQHEVKLWAQTDEVSVNSFSFANRCLSQVDLFSGS